MYNFLQTLLTNLGLNETLNFNLFGLNINLNMANLITSTILILVFIGFVIISKSILAILPKWIHEWYHKSLKRGIK